MDVPLVVIGGGGMGRCVLDLVDAVNLAAAPEHVFEVVGVLDDATPDLDLLDAREVKHLGPVSRLEELPRDVGYVIGIGSGQVRRSIDAYGQSLGRPCPRVLHPNVHLGFDVVLGPGAIVCSHVSMENNIRLGRHVHVNQNSAIGRDDRLADYVTVGPLVAVSGNVLAEEAVFLGTGSSVDKGVRLGHDSTVGTGAAVTQDVASETTVAGVPAHPVP